MVRSGIESSMTVHSFLFRHKNNRLRLSSNTVVIVDEAAMLPTNALVELFAVAKQHLLKLALFGDDRQLASVERGGMLPALIEKYGAEELIDVRRQKGWQKEVSELLSEGKTNQAAQLLESNNAIHWQDNKEQALSALIQTWAEDSSKHSAKDRLIIANKNVDVDTLNKAIQEVRQAKGELGSEGFTYQTARGHASFFQNDRICFTETNKELGIRNGAFGTIKALDEKQCTIELDQGQVIQFNPNTYQGLKLSYASTVYKSQGKSISQVYVLHDRSTNEKLSYVALTRQIESLKLFMNRKDTPTLVKFAQQINRQATKLPSIHFKATNEMDQKDQGTIKSLWQSIKTTTRNFLADTFHNNKAFYQIQKKSLQPANQPVIEKTTAPPHQDIQQFAQQSFERNLKYCRFIHFKNGTGRMPTIDDLPKIQDMATRLSVLEIGIYQESALNNEPKTQQQIAKLAREEFASGKQPDTSLVKEIQIKAEQQVSVLKREMENQVRQEKVGQLNRESRKYLDI
jgi:hypothetical protein